MIRAIQQIGVLYAGIFWCLGWAYIIYFNPGGKIELINSWLTYFPGLVMIVIFLLDIWFLSPSPNLVRTTHEDSNV